MDVLDAMGETIPAGRAYREGVRARDAVFKTRQKREGRDPGIPRPTSHHDRNERHVVVAAGRHRMSWASLKAQITHGSVELRGEGREREVRLTPENVAPVIPIERAMELRRAQNQ
jgi:hypothetical protein